MLRVIVAFITPFINDLNSAVYVPLPGHFAVKSLSSVDSNNVLESDVVCLFTEVPADGKVSVLLFVAPLHNVGFVPTDEGIPIVFPVNPDGADGAGFIVKILVLVSVSSVIDSDATLIICNNSGAFRIFLRDGSTAGEYKIFTNKGAGAVTVDPDNFRGADSDFTLAQNEGTQCIWDGTKWFIIGNESKLTIA